MTGFGTLLPVRYIPGLAGSGPNPSGSRRNGGGRGPNDAGKPNPVVSPALRHCMSARLPLSGEQPTRLRS
jgi:hypothetical protein